MDERHVRFPSITPPPGFDLLTHSSGLLLVSLAFTYFGWIYTQSINAYTTGYSSFNFRRMWQLGLSEMPLRFTRSVVDRIISYPGCGNDSTSYVQGAVRANSPQLALSFFYITTNNIFTRIATALEFRSFSLRRRGLRVSAPGKGSAQRGTYFMQFPLRYSVPLLAYFTLLHTFLSQALFLRRSYATYPISFDDPPEIDHHLVSFIGYSPLASFIFAIMLTLLVAVSLVMGVVKLDWILPDTTGDSRAISALCHPPPIEPGINHDENIASVDLQKTPSTGSAGKEASQRRTEFQTAIHLGKIRWGVTSMDIDGTGHCAFSLLPVRPPENGETYK